MAARMWASLKMTSIYINGEGRLVQTIEAKDKANDWCAHFDMDCKIIEKTVLFRGVKTY